MSEATGQVGSEKTKKRKNFSILDKLKILKDLDVNKSIKAISEKYDVPERSLRNWISNRKQYEEYERTYQLSTNSKRIKTTVLDELEEALYIWFDRSVKSGISLTGPLIKAKALELHTDLKITKNFVASEGWLTNWKKKYDIRQYTRTRCGEKLSANTVGANSFKNQYAKTIENEQLSLCQQFNADETGLNFKMMPKRTLAEKSQLPPTGFKVNKDRVTVMLCSNADGTLKIPLVVIGKSANPRVLKNLSRSSLPVYYSHQKSAWMSAHIFESWFRDEFVPRVTEFLSERGLPIKALLLLDNAPCHPSSEMLVVGDIRVQYLPPNSTSIIQPMDQGIIENFKRHYRSLFLQSILRAQRKGTDVNTHLKSINMKDIIYWTSDAWNSVTKETIFKCWKNLLPAHYYQNVDGNLTHSLTNENLLSNVREINDYGNVDESSVRNWIHSDELDVSVPSNSELIAMVTADKTEEPNKENFGPTESVGAEEAVSAANTLLSFFGENQLLSASELAVIIKAKEIAQKITSSE